MDEIKSILDSIEEENERILHGLDMFLNLARLDRFEVDLRVESGDPVALARQVANEHKEEFVVSSVFPKIECDKDKVKAVSNVLEEGARQYAGTAIGIFFFMQVTYFLLTGKAYLKEIAQTQ